MDLATRLKRTGFRLLGRPESVPAARQAETDAPAFAAGHERHREGTGGELQLAELLARLVPEDRDRLLAAHATAAHGRSSDGVFRLAEAEEGGWIELECRALPAEGGGHRGVTIHGRASTPRAPMPPHGGADPLTRLVFWSAAGGALQLAWDGAIRHRAPISLVAIELDDHAGLQQRLGRPAASRALASLGPLLGRIDGGGFGLRYGIGSCVVVLPNCSATVGRATAARLSGDVQALDATTERLSISTGLATIDPMAILPAEAVGGAFAALGLARHGGPNRHGLLDLRRGTQHSAAA